MGLDHGVDTRGLGEHVKELKRDRRAMMVARRVSNLPSGSRLKVQRGTIAPRFRWRAGAVISPLQKESVVLVFNFKRFRVKSVHGISP